MTPISGFLHQNSQSGVRISSSAEQRENEPVGVGWPRVLALRIRIAMFRLSSSAIAGRMTDSQTLQTAPAHYYLIVFVFSR